MKECKEFPKGCRIVPAEGCVRGIGDGLPTFSSRVVPRGRSLGYEHRTGGKGGVTWLAVQWDDEEDPNWFKKSCTQKQESHHCKEVLME